MMSGEESDRLRNQAPRRLSIPSRSDHGGNVDAFSTTEETTRAKRQLEDGLFPQEQKIVEEYFSAGESVLDLGCGAGRTTVQLEKADLEVVAVDVSEAMVDVAASQTGDTSLGVADATQLPFADGSFDNVLFSFNGLDYPHPAHERLRALSEIQRILKSDGIFAFSSHNSWYTLPALVDDWGFIRKFYVDEKNHTRISNRYKIHRHDRAEFETYFSNPFHQWRQLRRADFQLEAVVGKRNSPLRFLETMPYYVAKAP